MVKSKLLFPILLLFSLQVNAHKFYASINDFYYNPQTKSLEIILKFFVDDFETAIKSHYNQELHLGTAEEYPQSDSLLNLYLERSFFLWNDEKAISYNLIGHESDKDYVWLYIEVKSFKKDKTLTVKNSLLIEVFEEQSNQINLEIDGQIRTKYCLKNEDTVIF